MTSETGESTASINRRNDDRAWPRVREALEDGAILVFHPKIHRCATEHPNDRSPLHGLTISPLFVRKMEVAGVLQMIGVDKYALAGNGG